MRALGVSEVGGGVAPPDDTRLRGEGRGDGLGEGARACGCASVWGLGFGEQGVRVWEGAGRWQAGPPAGLLYRSGSCRAGPRAWGKAQARPAPPGRASPGLLAARAGRGQKNGPWAGPTGSGCMAIYNFDSSHD